MWLTLLHYPLYCHGLEPNLQYLWGMPVWEEFLVLHFLLCLELRNSHKYNSMHWHFSKQCRLLVWRTRFGSCLPHWVLAFVFHLGFSPPCTPGTIPDFGEFTLDLLLQRSNWIPLLTFEPCSNLNHYPLSSPTDIWAWFMKKKMRKSQRADQGQEVMSHWDQAVAAWAFFTGHWAGVKTQGHLSEKSRAED